MSDSTVTRPDLELMIRVIDDLSALDLSALDLFAADPIVLDRIDYKGFDAEALRAKIAAIAAKRKFDKTRIAQDIKTIVLVGLRKGNIRVDQLDRLAGKEAIKTLFRNWEIYMRPNAFTRNKLDRDTLTPSRVISLFPKVASRLMISIADKVADRLPNNSPRFPIKTFRLPIAMRHTGFASLIPNDRLNGFSELLEICHTSFMVEFGLIINPRNNDSIPESYVKQISFKEAAKSNDMPDFDRAVFLVSLGLDTWENIQKFIAVANSAAEVCKTGPRFAEADYEKFVDQEGFFKLTSNDADYKKIRDAAARTLAGGYDVSRNSSISIASTSQSVTLSDSSDSPSGNGGNCS